MVDGEQGRNRYPVEEDPPSTMNRRTFVKTGAVVAGIAWIGAFGGSLLRSLTIRADQTDEATQRAFTYHVPEGEEPWYADLDGREVMASEFPLGESAKVNVKGIKGILLRLDQAQLVDRVGSDLGFVAFSSTCTHFGCQVYFTRGTTPIGVYNQGVIYCPCHQGAFDPFRGAKVVNGPPPRPLPKIPLRVVDGRVEAV